MSLVDTDVLIWNLRGNPAAAELLDGHRGFALSAVTNPRRMGQKPAPVP